MWTLRREGEDGSPGRMFRLHAGRARTIGRAPRADFTIDAVTVSRVHCRLIVSRDSLEVEDLRSTNGTFVNDRRVERAALAPGDRLRVGRVNLIVGRS